MKSLRIQYKPGLLLAVEVLYWQSMFDVIMLLFHTCKLNAVNFLPISTNETGDVL